MQKTEQPVWLLHPSISGDFFYVLVLLVILVAFGARAGESIMEPLMMGALNQPAGKIFEEDSVDLWSNSEVSFTNFSLSISQPAGANSNFGLGSEFSSNVELEKQINPARDALLLIRENLSASDRSNVSLSVQAGYGRIWDEKSMFQKISSDYAEPGCAYVSANFNF